MIHLEEQLNNWATSVEQLHITPDIATRLGHFLEEAQANERKLDVFLYTYPVSGKLVTGFIVAPKKIKQKLPVIIFNRGGTGDFGMIPKGQYFTRIARMANWGYIIVGSYYPGNSFSEGTDERGGDSDIASVRKLHSLIRYLNMADESRIGMYGESRGGMMTYICMRNATWLTAAVTVGGLTNLRRSLSDRPEMKQIFEMSFGNTDEGIKRRSAVEWPEDMSKEIPLCIIHGGADQQVNPLDAIELAQSLERTSHPYSLYVIHEGNHMLTNKHLERDAIIKAWFDKHTKQTNEALEV